MKKNTSLSESMANPGGPRYEVVYGVGLLDDLHNYFPAFLYESGRFQNVPSIFHYMRTQIQNRFNLFSYGAGLYRERQPLPITPTPAPALVPPTPPPTTLFPTRTPLVTTDEENVMDSLNRTALLLGLLGAGLDTTPTLTNRLRIMRPTARIMEPVIVRPSAQVLEENTEILTGITGFSCNICQDSIRADESARRLRTCQHVYHRTCIDQWFERSVFCPTCRQDVRER